MLIYDAQTRVWAVNDDFPIRYMNSVHRSKCENNYGPERYETKINTHYVHIHFVPQREHVMPP
jgi:hypothetical protein